MGFPGSGSGGNGQGVLPAHPSHLPPGCRFLETSFSKLLFCAAALPFFLFFQCVNDTTVSLPIPFQSSFLLAYISCFSELRVFFFFKLHSKQHPGFQLSPWLVRSLLLTDPKMALAHRRQRIPITSMPSLKGIIKARTPCSLLHDSPSQRSDCQHGQ